MHDKLAAKGRAASEIKERFLALQEDVETHAAARKEAVSNYERELQLHAADAQALSDARRAHDVLDAARKQASVLCFATPRIALPCHIVT